MVVGGGALSSWPETCAFFHQGPRAVRGWPRSLIVCGCSTASLPGFSQSRAVHVLSLFHHAMMALFRNLWRTPWSTTACRP